MSGSTPTSTSLIKQKDTAIQSFHQEQGKKRTQVNKQLILNAIIKRVRACDREIMDDTGLPINIVCARRNELVASGLVEDAGTGVHVGTGKKVTMWKRTVAQPELFAEDSHMSSQKKRKKIQELCQLHMDSIDGSAELAKKILEVLNKK